MKTRWAGHVARMRAKFKVFRQNSVEKKPYGRGSLDGKTIL